MPPLKQLKLLLALTSFMLACCTPQKKAPEVTWLYNNAEIEKLNGNVKQITESKFNILHDTTYTNIDEWGNITNVKETFDDQSREYNYVTLFDKEGKRAKAIVTHKEWGNPKDSVIYKFSKNGLIKLRYTTEKFMPLTTFYKYNAAGNVIDTEFYTDKRHLIFLRTYEYDNHGLIVQDNTYSNYGRYRAGLHFNRRDSSQYLTIDSKKNWTKMISGADTVSRKIIYY